MGAQGEGEDFLSPDSSKISNVMKNHWGKSQDLPLMLPHQQSKSPVLVNDPILEVGVQIVQIDWQGFPQRVDLAPGLPRLSDCNQEAAKLSASRCPYLSLESSSDVYFETVAAVK